MKNWPEIAASSHYLAAIEVKKSLQEGHVMEAEQGLSELIDAMSRADRRAVKSQLVRLMKHIIKWKKQPEKRASSWVRTILNARMEIEDIQEETPSITNDIIHGLWSKAFQLAINEAMDEMELDNLKMDELSWEEVFTNEYLLDKTK